MGFVTTISQGGSFATTVTQGGSTWTLDQVSAPATFTASIATIGPKGDPGEAATVEVGTVTTLDPGEPATVVNSGTEAAAILDFGIPKGEVGETGPQGPQGIPGVISATAPLAYDSGTQTVSISTAPEFTSVRMGAGIFKPIGETPNYPGDFQFEAYKPDKVLQVANNLSDLANTGTARSNLGLGTMATEAAADYLAKAGNLAGLADLSASRTNLDVYSRAQSDALVPAASTTVAGKVELATETEAVETLSTTLAMTPANVRAAISNIVYSNQTGSGVANGGGTGANIWDTFTLATSGTLANSSARRYSATNSASFLSACIPGQPVYKVDFSKVFAIRWGLGIHSNSSAQFEKVVMFVAQDISNLGFSNDEVPNIGFGFVLYPTGDIKISSRNASTVSSATIASGIPMTRTTTNNNPATEVVQVSDGLGNLLTYINGTLVNTLTTGPTSLSNTGTSPFALWGTGITNGSATPTATCTWSVAYPKVFFGR